MLQALERLRIQLVVKLLWASPVRMADAVRGFQATEADGVWHLHRGLRRIHDPKQRATVFTHSLEEESHAEEFARVYGEIASRTMVPANYERDDLYAPDVPLWRSFAFVHVGEEDATERFRHLHGALPEGPLREALGRIVEDEDTHVDLTHRMLVAMGAREGQIRGAYVRVRAARAWERWLRGGKRVIDVIATALLSAAYLVLGLFLAAPSRRRLRERVVSFDNNHLKRLA